MPGPFRRLRDQAAHHLSRESAEQVLQVIGVPPFVWPLVPAAEAEQ